MPAKFGDDCFVGLRDRSSCIRECDRVLGGIFAATLLWSMQLLRYESMASRS